MSFHVQSKLAKGNFRKNYYTVNQSQFNETDTYKSFSFFADSLPLQAGSTVVVVVVVGAESVSNARQEFRV